MSGPSGPFTRYSLTVIHSASTPPTLRWTFAVLRMPASCIQSRQTHAELCVVVVVSDDDALYNAQSLKHFDLVVDFSFVKREELLNFCKREIIDLSSAQVSKKRGSDTEIVRCFVEAQFGQFPHCRAQNGLAKKRKGVKRMICSFRQVLHQHEQQDQLTRRGIMEAAFPSDALC